MAQEIAILRNPVWVDVPFYSHSEVGGHSWDHIHCPRCDRTGLSRADCIYSGPILKSCDPVGKESVFLIGP